MRCFVVLFVSLLLSYYLIADNYLTRGHQPGEIYISSTWFRYIDTATSALFYSDDFGQSISLRYYHSWYSGGMPIRKIVTDYSPGVIYNDAINQLWRSFDGGYSWDSLSIIEPSGFYTSGNKAGEIYGRYSGVSQADPGLYRSSDYGDTFLFTADSVYGYIEVGVEGGEIYYYYGPNSCHNLIIKYSNDYGQSFSTICVLDSIISGYGAGLGFPSLSRGTTDGELYLTTLFPYHSFKIFYSSDRGQSWELRFESGSIDPFNEDYSFTAGKKPGSFFYSKSIELYHGGANTLLCIYHSNDTAKTFTEYCHVLDTNFPVGIYNEDIIEHNLLSFYNYPNPFTNTTTLKFENIEPGNYLIEVTSLSGQAVLRKEEYLNIGDKQVQLNTSSFSPGVYLCSIKQNGQVVGVQKMVKR